jgi:hypothetical protein
MWHIQIPPSVEYGSRKRIECGDEFPLVTNYIDGWQVMLIQESMGSTLEIWHAKSCLKHCQKIAV